MPVDALALGRMRQQRGGFAPSGDPQGLGAGTRAKVVLQRRRAWSRVAFAARGRGGRDETDVVLVMPGGCPDAREDGRALGFRENFVSLAGPVSSVDDSHAGAGGVPHFVDDVPVGGQRVDEKALHLPLEPLRQPASNDFGTSD